MMPIDFEGSNITLSKPSNMTDEQCLEIKGFKGTDGDNFPFILTMWKPNKEDIAAINAGDPICLKILGHSIPPVCLFTVDEKGQVNT